MKNILLFASFFALFSCGSDDTASTLEASSNTSATKEAVHKTNFDGSCIGDKIDNFPTLLSDAKLLEITGKTTDGLTKSTSEYEKPFYNYDWEGVTGRKTTLKNGWEVDVEDFISILVVNTKESAQNFKSGYYPVDQSVNEKQGSKLQQEVELALKGESSNKSMIRSVEKSRESGMSDEDILKMFSGLSNMAKESSVKKEIVSGVGDAAVWDTSTHELMINAGDVTFWVIVTLNEDNKKDREIAKKIAQLVLNACG